ncbi:MAG: hypothetical protein EOO56_20485 [Hymenobacter sp.]|nr:MAG: hypothetical protein EOO56_20485 [Hymenobacter sp.]
MREGKGPCCLLTTGPRAKSDLRVRNDSQRQLHFVAIDQCLYTDADPTKCDCALLDSEVAYFVEFKTSEHGNDPAIVVANANPGDCTDQLAASIRDFYDRGIIQAGQLVVACASVGFPRHKPQSGAHFQEQLASLQRKIQLDTPRSVRLRYNSESELSIK